MAAQVAAVVGDRSALALHDVLEVGDVGLARLADRPPLPLRHDHRGVDASAQLALSLRPRQAVGVTGRALQPELALDTRPADPP
jgi:hypothetical protein